MKNQNIQAVLLDTVSIQGYIFASNKLKENLGASHLVKKIYRSPLQEVKSPLEEVIRDMYGVAFGLEAWEQSAAQLFEQHANIDVGYIGGGNALLLFKENTAEEAKAKAKIFVQHWTTRLLRDMPGITTAVAYHATTQEDLETNFKQVNAELRKSLRKNSQQYLPQTTLPRHGITTECPRSGLSAEIIVTEEDQYLPVSSMVKAKLGAVEEEKDAILKEFGDILGDTYMFTGEISELGQKKGEDSHIAIVHIDGNDMSGEINEIDSLPKLRAFSRDVRQTTEASLRALLSNVVSSYNTIMEALGWNPDATNHELQCPWGNFRLTDHSFDAFRQNQIPEAILNSLKRLKERTFSTSPLFRKSLQEKIGEKETEHYWPQIFNDADKKKILPLRSIILGGDDITFVCDGRLGIYFAKLFMEAFQKQQEDQELTACAGIAIIKTKYPFSRGYELAEELCRNAKRTRRKIGDAASYLDFHISFGGIFGDLDQIRQKYFSVPQGDLLFRPFRVASEANSDGRNLDQFLKHAGKLEKNFPRNKQAELRNVLTLSKAATTQFVQEMAYRDRTVPEIEGGRYQRTLFDQGKTPYFDMIELLRLYPDVVRKQEGKQTS